MTEVVSSFDVYTAYYCIICDFSLTQTIYMPHKNTIWEFLTSFFWLPIFIYQLIYLSSMFVLFSSYFISDDLKQRSNIWQSGLKQVCGEYISHDQNELILKTVASLMYLDICLELLFKGVNSKLSERDQHQHLFTGLVVCDKLDGTTGSSSRDYKVFLAVIQHIASMISRS